MWYSGMAPARPRRSSELERGAFEMSSCVTTLRTFRPALPTIFMTMLPQSMSPAWFSTSSSTPWPLSAILTASNTSCGFGAAKMSPTTWMSTMPSPTKPHWRGLVAGAAEGDDGDAVRLFQRAADDEVALHVHGVRVGEGEALQQLVGQAVGVVDKLLHLHCVFLPL